MALRAVERDREPLMPDEWVASDAAPEDRYFAIYARISDAKEDAAKQQQTPGIERQVADCELKAKAMGAKRIRYYREGGSAFREDKERRVFDRLLEDIESGEISHVIAWKVERLARRSSDAERLMSAAAADSQEPRAVIHTVDGISSADEMGKMLLRQLVMFGRWESVSIGTRVRRARQQAIEAGEFSGSPPAFGHRDGSKWREAVPEEAALIREAAERIIAGEGVRSILRDYNQRGSRTRRGALWQHRAWIKLITGPRMVGMRQREDGSLVSGTDESGRPLIAPILDRETWDQVREILLDPARRPHKPGGTPRHLLTGLMRCGVCREPLRAKGNSGKAHTPDYWTYGCVKDAYHDEACGKVWIKGVKTDDYIEGLVRAHLRQPAVRRALTHLIAGREEAPGERLVEAQRELAEIQELITKREVIELDGPEAIKRVLEMDSMESYRRWKRGKLELRDALAAEVSRLSRAKSTMRAIANPETFWDQAALEERRDLVRSLFEEVTILPVSALPDRSNRWDARRVRWVPIAY